MTKTAVNKTDKFPTLAGVYILVRGRPKEKKNKSKKIPGITLLPQNMRGLVGAERKNFSSLFEDSHLPLAFSSTAHCLESLCIQKLLT